MELLKIFIGTGLLLELIILILYDHIEHYNIVSEKAEKIIKNLEDSDFKLEEKYRRKVKKEIIKQLK